MVCAKILSQQSHLDRCDGDISHAYFGRAGGAWQLGRVPRRLLVCQLDSSRGYGVVAGEHISRSDGMRVDRQQPKAEGTMAGGHRTSQNPRARALATHDRSARARRRRGVSSTFCADVRFFRSDTTGS